MMMVVVALMVSSQSKNLYDSTVEENNVTITDRCEPRVKAREGPFIMANKGIPMVLK